MELTADLTNNDYAAFRRYAMFRFRKVWLFYAFVGIFVGWISFSGDPIEGVSFSTNVLMAVIIGAIAAGATPILGWLVMMLLPNRPAAAVGKHVFTLSDLEFQEKNDIGVTSVRLDLLRRHETARHIFLVTPAHVAFVLPKRALEAAPEFLRVLMERTKDA